jgi:hypothetical protein
MKNQGIIAVTILMVLGLSSQMYGSGSKVVKLTASDFNQKVIQSNELWLVEFYGTLG